MTISSKLSRYLARSYFLNMIGFLFALLAVVYLFDTVELLRRASDKAQLETIQVLQMGLFKLPEVGQILLPFVILFSGIFTFWKLTHRHELIVVRSVGISAWQFLGPIVAVAILIGVMNITLFNPIGAALLARFEKLENQYLTHQKSFVTLSKQGLWLRQVQENENLSAGSAPNDISNSPTSGHMILHAQKINLPDWTLDNVMLLFFDQNDKFTRRIDAKTAKIQQQTWIFEDAVSNVLYEQPEKIPFLAISTDLTTKELEERFASPETISFWELPNFIKTLELTGFEATTMKIHYHSLLAQPLFFAAMILLAATVSLRPPRFKGSFMYITLGIAAGFLIFFLATFLKALGASHQIPYILAAWTPPLVTFLCSVGIMLNLEDG